MHCHAELQPHTTPRCRGQSRPRCNIKVRLGELSAASRAWSRPHCRAPRTGNRQSTLLPPSFGIPCGARPNRTVPHHPRSPTASPKSRARPHGVELPLALLQLPTSTFAPSCATRSMANSWTAPHSARASRYEPPGPCSRCAADRDSLQWRATLKAWGARPGLALFSSKPGTSVATPTPSCRARRAATLWFPASRLVAAGALNPQPSCGCLHKRAASAHAAVRYALRTACVSRWGGIIAAAAQRALASSLEHEVLQDARWLDAPVSNRPPART